MTFKLDYNTETVNIAIAQSKRGLVSRLFSTKSSKTIDNLSRDDRHLLFAIADLKHAAEKVNGSLDISTTTISMDHQVAAQLSSSAALALGLPPTVDLTLHTDIKGLPGSSEFELRHSWLQFGQKQNTKRVGSILVTSEGPRRLPIWLMHAVELAENFERGGKLEDHWSSIAKFRQALEPDFNLESQSQKNLLEMSSFLKGLKVKVADSFSILPLENNPTSDYDVIPFSLQNLSNLGQEIDSDAISISMSELVGEELTEFQDRVRRKGKLPSYRVADGSFLVIEKSAGPALKVMSEMYFASSEDRRAFIQNPRQKITEAIETDLRERGLLDGITSAQEEETVELAALPVFIETSEYSERVLGKAVYTSGSTGLPEGSATTWLPELFGETVSQLIKSLAVSELETIEDSIKKAVENGEDSVEYGGERIPASPTSERAIRSQIEHLISDAREGITDSIDEPDTSLSSQTTATGPIILDIKSNLEQLEWRANVIPRNVTVSRDITENIVTKLKNHQIDSFKWQIKAWESGLPGILNSDEPGLGKTLQTIAFLAWLKTQLSSSNQKDGKGPILVVAPTSLLENWEQEVEIHMGTGGLGHLVRLYGSAISARKKTGAIGKDTKTGSDLLDLDFLSEATENGQGHKFWVLTTYTTLTNYQHSIGRIPFSVSVFDEIQALKNPSSLRALAGMAMKSDFRIGLTGTPIENSTTDLWAILEQLSPGRVMPLSEFRKKYSTPEEGRLQELYEFVFVADRELPPMALRRLKDNVAKDLLKKTRLLRPRLMPTEQAIAYEDARSKLALGQKGAALKMLHHIRSVSVHPSITAIENTAEFINLSGRLQATFEILDEINERDQRALVFIEHIQMQYRFIELLKARYRMNRVDLINGATPIHKRQEIVNHFQRHLQKDEGFDVLVLGPKAAGTGLTLTTATHVIHLSRWWNPAVEEQCNDRVHRIGQLKPVTVHVPMSIHPEYQHQSFDCLLHSLMTRKRKLASSALWPMGDTSEDSATLQSMLVEDTRVDVSTNVVSDTVIKMFERDQLSTPEQLQPGVFKYD
jgi:superfamily II DNA or RNA helicase